MGRGRLEAFSDGVIAIIITIMVLELKIPHEPTIHALRPYGPVFASYVVSFCFVGIYWNGHHHMLHLVRHVSAPVMWMNLHLLFWLSLVPVVTGWVGEHPEAPLPAQFYGGVLLCAALAFNALQRAIVRTHPGDDAIKTALGRTRKGTISEVMYVAGIALAFVHPWIADALYIAVAVMWFIPDRTIEAAAKHGD